MISNMMNLLAQSQDFPMPQSSMEHPEAASYWFPEQASTFAPQIDFLYMAIFWISTFFFVIIVALMFYFCVKYRRQAGVKQEASSSHNTTIEILWSVLPSIILVWIFYEGAKGFYEMRVAPDTAEEIQVEAFQFGWTFTYPDGDQSSELHLVKDRPTKLVMRSRDVLHSFYVAAFRQKNDLVPGRYTYVYLNPTLCGEFRLTCTEYCGEGHSRMRTVAVVHPDDATRKSSTQWITAEHPPAKNGERLFKIHCRGCHNINGVAGTGPAMNLIWDTDEKLEGGGTVHVDENYIEESIKNPDAKIVAGYGPVSKMPSFEGKLSQADIGNLIAYIKLKDGMANVPDRMPAESETKAEGAEANAPAGEQAQEPDATNEPPAAEPSVDGAGKPDGN